MTLYSKTIILGVVLFIAGCTNVHGRSGRIFGGNSVLIENYPYQASLRDIFGNHFCGGSIISEKHILTAAHCMNDKVPFTYVVTGTSDRKGTTGKHHFFSKIDVHPDWIPLTGTFSSEPLKNDIAVITLEDEIVFDKYQQKIDLPSHDFENGLLANVTGWGLTRQNPVNRPKQLQLIETKIVSREECEKKMSQPGVKVDDIHVCALHIRGRGACSGDSGGPLAIDGKMVGITSWLDGDYCGDGLPEIYTNVYKFKSYIESILKNSE